ncbi:MAG: TorF family putative porin [Burkholderiaceae bacterium]
MKKIILAAAVTTVFAGNFSHAEDAAPAAAPTPDNVVVYNIGIASDYRYRGISQTRFQPALQGGVDYTNNPTGLYAGTWLSTINWIKDYVNSNSTTVSGKGPVEWDLYGGKRGDIGAGFNYDVGGLYYFYPSNNYDAIAPNKNANTFELYGQVGYGPGYLKYSHSLTTLFGTADSTNSGYLDLGVNPDLGNGFTLNLHAGHQKVAGTTPAVGGNPAINNSFYSYTDWKIGVTKAFDPIGLSVSLAAIGTNAKDLAYASAGKTNLGKKGAVLSVVKTF